LKAVTNLGEGKRSITNGAKGNVVVDIVVVDVLEGEVVDVVVLEGEVKNVVVLKGEVKNVVVLKGEVVDVPELEVKIVDEVELEGGFPDSTESKISLAMLQRLFKAFIMDSKKSV